MRAVKIIFCSFFRQLGQGPLHALRHNLNLAEFGVISRSDKVVSPMDERARLNTLRIGSPLRPTCA